ncbi:MAG: TetR/AcrR family transcriptional regulator [Acidobacteria bacterium]|nr:TetR/AcrR family transcriptional regulator [Acidobacteriota bacterium]
MGTKERQQRDRDRLRHAILTAARDLFVTEGYRNVSMRKVADRIEYSAAAIYSYFPSKDDIFFALAEEGFRLLADELLATVKDTADPLDRLRRGLWAFYEFSKSNREYFELMFVDRSVPSLSQDFQRFEFFQETTARAEADLQACIARGEFSRELNPAAALHVLWVGMLGAATIGLSQRLAPGEDPDALARDLLDTLLSGFTTGIRSTFVASECAFHASAAVTSTTTTLNHA